MRLDHIAYRVKDREKTAKFFIDALGYKTQEEFTIDFGNNQTAKCIALEPPEKPPFLCPWIMDNFVLDKSQKQITGSPVGGLLVNYHMAPEVFISDGSVDSIVGKWVENRGGIGGVHHIAYQVDSVETIMKLWVAKGYAEFSTTEPLEIGRAHV